MRFTDPFNFAISERLRNLLKSEGVTGWGCYPLEIKNVSEKLYGFQVLGRCGALVRPYEPGFVVGCEFDFDT